MRKTLTESLIETIELVREGKLDADERFIETDFAELLEICNACGAKNSRLPVPQTAYGMSLKPMCHVHDFDYHAGKTIGNKDMADRRMKNNGQRLIEMRSSWVLSTLRRARVYSYYLMVHRFGGPAFWDGKTKS